MEQSHSEGNRHALASAATARSLNYLRQKVATQPPLVTPRNVWYIRYMTTAKLFMNGRSQAVRLPKEFRFDGTEVSIQREGDAVILRPIERRPWPDEFFESIAIKDPAFKRPKQPVAPKSRNLNP
jgi:antitoxin VapB